MAEHYLEVHDVSVRFGDFTALDGVGWSVDGPGVIGLIGLNGAGKTTLIRTVLGLQPVSAGSVRVPIGLDALGYCPDTPGFEPWLTAREVLEQSRAIGPARPTSAWSVDATLEAVDLQRHAHRRTGGFSRGMLQRLGIAAALVRAPEVLILDEPTSALDPEGRAAVLALIRDLGGRMTVVFSSHLLADVEDLADRLLVLHRGRTVFAGPTAEFLDLHAGAPTLRIAMNGGRIVEAEPAAWGPALADAAAHSGEIADIRLTRPSLTDAFFTAIGEKA
ncbi:ABC transporter ATP-binding protein [Nocardia sp. CDC160]|uniref:ABC transporter ATP-binding protein n=1 Tax=Nocardia sp. CDC160 TaxID=3112166 RepID=UPI002DBE3615|nr:ABC transporter ATP-binding protein [Nocardia sp. CDC160]MEC3917732.1 ABC transporter ATP-binding protein [Nocardia sp. CDC160]